MRRQHEGLMIHELEELVNRHWNHPIKLAEYQRELIHRVSPAAKILKDRVQERLSQTKNKADENRKNSSSDTPKSDLDPKIDRLIKEINRLESENQILKQENSLLRNKINIQEQMRNTQDRKNHNISDFGRVHLADSAPQWLIVAARAAFRKQYHPDRYQDDARRRQSHDVFVRADQIFDRLLKG